MSKISLYFLSLIVLFPCTSLAQGQRKEKPKQLIKAIAIGARRTAKFKRSTKQYKIKMEGPDGQEIEETIPAGVPIEIAGKENEYVPYQLYAKNSGSKDKLSRFSLGLNSFSPEVKLPAKETLSLFKRRVIPAEDGGKPKYKLEPYASAPSQVAASHSLVTIVKNHKELEGWAKPLVKVFNISPERFGSNSCLVYNSSPFNMVIKFGGLELINLRPFTHKYVSDLKKDKYGAIPYEIFLKSGSIVERLPSGALVSRDNSRHYIFTFVDPRKGVKRRGDLAVFSEKVPAPLLPHEAEGNEGTN